MDNGLEIVEKIGEIFETVAEREKMEPKQQKQFFRTTWTYQQEVNVFFMVIRISKQIFELHTELPKTFCSLIWFSQVIYVNWVFLE